MTNTSAATSSITTTMPASATQIAGHEAHRRHAASSMLYFCRPVFQKNGQGIAT